jgi:hypothetical protein
MTPQTKIFLIFNCSKLSVRKMIFSQSAPRTTKASSLELERTPNVHSFDAQPVIHATDGNGFTMVKRTLGTSNGSASARIYRTSREHAVGTATHRNFSNNSLNCQLRILLRYCRRLHQEHESFAGSFAFELIKRHKANGIINTIVVV